MDFKKLGDFQLKSVGTTKKVKTPQKKTIGGLIAPGPPGKPAGKLIRRTRLPWWQIITTPEAGKDGDVDKYDEQLVNNTIASYDISGDKKVDSNDIAVLSRYLLGVEDLDGDGKVTKKDAQIKLSIRSGKGDVNKDGKIDDKDLAALLGKIKDGDVNKDGSVDTKDAKEIRDIIKKFDLSGDGKVDSGDVEMLARFMLGAPDLDGNGVVDRRDFFLKFALSFKADFNKDGKVDFKDLKMLMDNIRKGDVSKDKKKLVRRWPIFRLQNLNAPNKVMLEISPTMLERAKNFPK